jgi:hypothetical protein
VEVLHRVFRNVLCERALVTIKLRNIGNEDLKYVKVDLNSLDGHGLLIYGTYKTIEGTKQDETEARALRLTHSEQQMSISS